MRFAIVFAVVFGLCDIGYAEDPKEQFAQKSGNRRSRETPEYRAYLQREKALDPFRVELQRCLKDETADPSLILLSASWKLAASKEELNLGDDDWNKLSKRMEKICDQTLTYLDKVDEKKHFKAFLLWRYYLADSRVSQSEHVPEGYPGCGKEPVSFLMARGLWKFWLPEFSRRADAEKSVRKTLDRVAKHRPQNGDPPFCHRIWKNKLLDAAYLIKRWKLEDQIAEFKQWQVEVKKIAKQDANDLLADLEALDNPPLGFIPFADERLDFLFQLVTYEEVGTTRQAVKDLITRKWAALRRT